MIPSRKWFPSSLPSRASWFQNFEVQFTLIAASLGFLPADVTAVQNDNEAFQWIADETVKLEAFMESVRLFRKTLSEGDIGDPAPDYPPLPTEVPSIDVPTGIFERLIKLVERIRTAPLYTPEVGGLLGIIPSATDPIAPEAMQPDPKLLALPGNVVRINFTRGKTQGIDVQMQLDNSGTWEHVGRFYNSPGELVVEQNGQATARSVQIRARYVIDNQPVGQYSDTDNVSTIP